MHYSISSYGADYDVEGLVKRLERGDIFIPDFQRKYVWRVKEASEFVESLLLGLPVPGVFFAREQDTNRLLVIDGQQRLKTLQFFYKGYFNPKNEEKSSRIFKLEGVQDRFNGKTYESLSEADRIRLNDSLIHATIIKQDSPDNDNTSVYHVFDRLNSTGSKLSPQEIRTAIYHGDFIDLLKELNNYPSWRGLIGAVSQRLKDQELILRYFALLEDRDSYSRPMEEFLNRYASKNKKASGEKLLFLSDEFHRCVDFLNNYIGKKAFRITRTVNTAALDAVMVATTEILRSDKEIDSEKFIKNHTKLFSDPKFINLVSKATSNEEAVDGRIKTAIDILSE